MLIIYRKSTGEVVENLGTNTLFPNGISDSKLVIKNVVERFGGTSEEYAEFRLHDVDDIEYVNMTATHEYKIKNNEIVFGDNKPIPEPEPQPPSEIDLVRLEMARGNAELFETMIALMGGV